MSDIEVSDEAVQIIADHCFGEAHSKKEWALEVARVALEDAADLVVVGFLKSMDAEEPSWGSGKFYIQNLIRRAEGATTVDDSMREAGR